jgi:hypothetical protein
MRCGGPGGRAREALHRKTAPNGYIPEGTKISGNDAERKARDTKKS